MLQPRLESELIKAGERLLKGEWKLLRAPDRRALIADFCRGFVTPPLSVTMPTTYRGRLNENAELFTKVEELLAPPAEYVKRIGRLNRPKTSLLYLSGTAFGAVSEIRPSFGDLVSILACRMRPTAEPLVLAPLAMTDFVSNRRIGPVNPLHLAGPLGNQDFKRVLDERGLTKQWLYQASVINYLVTLAADESEKEALYDLTNSISEHLYGTFPDYEGIQYPGIAVGLTTLNTALQNKRWNDIEPLEVWVVEVSSDIFATDPTKPKLFTSKLHSHGTITPGGTISYAQTNQTLLSAWNDFKNRHGTPAVRHEGLESVLLVPFTRYRIRWHPNPQNYDFLMPEWP